jgi:hypothetical protein
MKKFRSFPFTAPEQAWVLGGKTKLVFEGFVEKAHENEKRTIIDGFEVFCRMTLTVGADDTLDGRDLYRAFRSITVEQLDGVKRYDEIPGDALRVFNYAELGRGKVKEHQDVAGGEANTAADIIVSAYVPMRKEFIDSPYDTSMPADVFKNIRIGMAQNADMQVGTTTIAITAAQYWVSADCHAEPVAKTYAVDVVSIDDFETDTQTKINITGRPHGLYLYVPATGAGGGDLLTGIDEAMIVDVYQQSQLTNPDLITRYARERDVCEGQYSAHGFPVWDDPFVPAVGNPGVPRALALLLPTGNHPDEGPVRQNLTIKLTESSSPGKPRLISRVLMERSDKLDAAQAKKFGATGVSPDRNPADKKIAPRDAKFFPGKLTR